MDRIYQQNLQDQVTLCNSTRIQKILRSPMKMIYMKVLQVVSERFNITVRVKAQTFWGAEMTVVLPELTSGALLGYGFHDEDVTRFLLEHLETGMTFFDIGAHFGYFALLAARIVGNTGQVHAFEPTPSTYEVLRANVQQQNNVHVRNLALWSKETSLRFNDYGVKLSAWNGHYRARMDEKTKKRFKPKQYQVQAVTLDGYISTSGVAPDFVKIDVERAEGQILSGMEKTLREIRPIICIEIADVGIEEAADSKTLVKHIMERGYEPLEFSNGGITRHQLKEHYPFDNILFVPR